MYTSVKINKSNLKGKKLVAKFFDNNGRLIKKIYFGATGYSDFTKHKDEERKKRYIQRHKVRENWNVPDTRASLSRWILWEKPNLKESIKFYKNKFNLK